MHKAWGLHTTIDIKGCDADLIRSEKHLYNCFIALCELIEMKRFGEPIIIHFGESEEVAGFTGVQLIETSDITCHLANKTNKAYFDVFSCKWYAPFLVAEFLKNWFKGSEYSLTIVPRK